MVFPNTRRSRPLVLAMVMCFLFVFDGSDRDEDLRDIVLFVGHIEGRDDVLITNGAADLIAIGIDPSDGPHMAMDEGIMAAHMNGGNGLITAADFKKGSVKRLKHSQRNL